MSPMAPERDARLLRQLETLKEAGDGATFFSQADALLASPVHREVRLLAASSAGVYATTTCGIGSAAARYFEQVIKVSQEFAYLEEDFWLTKTGAIENLLILAADFETSARWAERLRGENPRAEVLRTWVERNETRHVEGLSWAALQTAVAGGYLTQMQRPGWAAAILEALLSSDQPRAHREWRTALMAYLGFTSVVVAEAFNELARKGDASRRYAAALVAFLLQPARRLTAAYLHAFPSDRPVEKAATEFLEGSSRLPEVFAEVVSRAGRPDRKREAPDDGPGPPLPPVWVQSAPLVRENVAHGLAGSRFRLVSVDRGVDRQRAPEPVACAALRFAPAGAAPEADGRAIHLALRSAVWLTLAYAANRSGRCWAATAPVNVNQVTVGLGQGVPAQIIFIGTDPAQGIRDRVWMGCVSDAIEGGWVVKVLPQIVRSDQAGTLAKVNDALCEAFRDYLDVELELLGSPVCPDAR